MPLEPITPESEEDAAILRGLGITPRFPALADGDRPGQGNGAAPSISTTLGPMQNPTGWSSVTVGPFTFPLAKGDGTVRVEVTSEQKLDEQKASGKDKAKTKRAGVQICAVTIDLTFQARAWPTVEAMLTGIDPNSAATGGPFDITHPEAGRRQVKSIMVKKVGPVKWSGPRLGSCRIEATEWTEPKAATSGLGAGTGVPKKSIAGSSWLNNVLEWDAEREAARRQDYSNPDGLKELTAANLDYSNPGNGDVRSEYSNSPQAEP
jgi:hypothetical protein